MDTVKHLPLIIASTVIIACVLAGDWVIRVHVLQEPRFHHPSLVAAGANQTQPPGVPKAPMNEWQEYHAAREQALRDNPELAAEYEELKTEIEQQQHDVDAAMIKADPQVAPIIAKIALFRRGALPPSSSQGVTINGAVTK